MGLTNYVLTVEQQIRRVIEFTFVADPVEFDIEEVAREQVVLPRPNVLVVDEEVLNATIINLEAKEPPHVP